MISYIFVRNTKKFSNKNWLKEKQTLESIWKIQFYQHYTENVGMTWEKNNFTLNWLPIRWRILYRKWKIKVLSVTMTPNMLKVIPYYFFLYQFYHREESEESIFTISKFMFLKVGRVLNITDLVSLGVGFSKNDRLLVGLTLDVKQDFTLETVNSPDGNLSDKALKIISIFYWNKIFW